MLATAPEETRVDKQDGRRITAAIIAIVAWTGVFGQMALNFAAAPGQGVPIMAGAGQPLRLFYHLGKHAGGAGGDPCGARR